MDSRCPTPLVITGGMNTKKSSWVLAHGHYWTERTGPLTARLRSDATAPRAGHFAGMLEGISKGAWRFADGEEYQQSGGAWVAEVLAHGHHREKGRQAGARGVGLGLWAQKAWCHRSPAQGLPKPATSQLPEKRRSLRE